MVLPWRVVVLRSNVGWEGDGRTLYGSARHVASSGAFGISYFSSSLCFYFSFSIPTVMEALSGETTGCVDPYVEEIEILPYQALQPHQDAVITAAEAIVRKYLVDREP
jgi:hypothetical protein